MTVAKSKRNPGQVVTLTSYRTQDVARLLGWTPAAVRSCVRRGYVSPARGTRREFLFSFQDLVILRTIRELVDSGVTMRKVGRVLSRVVEQLPEQRSLAGVRILADGDRVVVKDGNEVWNPESGQRVLDFRGGGEEREAPLRHEGRKVDDGPDLSAEEWYQLGVELEPDSSPEAKKAYRKAVEMDPAHAEAQLNLGRLLHEEGRLRSAETCYRAALKARPGSSTAQFNLAVALEDLQRPIEALSAYEKVLSMDAEYADAYFNLAGIYERLGKRAEALQYLKTYRTLTTV